MLFSCLLIIKSIENIIVFFILSIIFLLINYIEYKKYTNVFNIKLNIIVSNIKEKYPETEINKIIELLNSPNSEDNNIFQVYGIDLNKDAVILENKNHFQKYLIIEISIFCVLFITLSIIFLIYNKTKDKKLKKITQYIESINRVDYKLDIEDNTEDEL